jgi:hypothetical protein
MSSSRRGRSAVLSEIEAESVPSKIGKELGRRKYNEAGQLSSDRVSKLLGERFALDHTQREELINGISAFADFAVSAFVEQRKQRKTAVSEQPVPTLVTPAEILAVV